MHRSRSNIMTDFVNIEAAAHDPFAGLLVSLQMEFEGAADAHLAREIVAAEELDFLWEARIATRRIGTIELLDDSSVEAHIWQLIGCLDSRWFVAKVGADEDDRACDLLEVRRFDSAWDAYEAYD
jgi:hypothetical protein